MVKMVQINNYMKLLILKFVYGLLQNGYGTMIMVVDIDGLDVPFTSFVDVLSELGKNNGLDVRTMHEDVFNSMHRI